MFSGAGMSLFLSAVPPKVPDHPVFVGETMLRNGPANHFVGVEGVGGWLYLTSGRLYFRSHSLNIQNHECSLMLDDVTAHSPRREGARARDRSCWVPWW